MKSQFNMTRGVVRVTGDDKMGLDRVFDVSGMRKGVFLVRFYNADAEGTLYLESSNQNTDATDALWLSIGSVAITSSSANIFSAIVGDEDELFSYLRWRFDYTSGSGGTTFEITGYGLDCHQQSKTAHFVRVPPRGRPRRRDSWCDRGAVPQIA